MKEKQQYIEASPDDLRPGDMFRVSRSGAVWRVERKNAYMLRCKNLKSRYETNFYLHNRWFWSARYERVMKLVSPFVLPEIELARKFDVDAAHRAAEREAWNYVGRQIEGALFKDFTDAVENGERMMLPWEKQT